MSTSFRELVDEVEKRRGYVYLIRNGDLHKIGVTMNLERRMKELRPDEVIAVYQAVNVTGVERLLHSRYKDVRLPQTEYFRLSQEQVREVKSVLNGGEDSNAQPAHKWIQELEERRQDILGGVASIFDGADADKILWTEHADSGGQVHTVLHWLLHDPYAMEKLPASQATLDAAERMLVKDDAIAPIAKASSLDELEAASVRFLDDFALVYCWLVDSKTLVLCNRRKKGDDQAVDNVIKEFKGRLNTKGLRWAE